MGFIAYELGDVCARLSSGKGISAKQIAEVGKYPVYGGNGLRGYTETANFCGDCAIIGRQGAFCGNVRYFSGEAYMTEHAVVVCANEKHNTRYLSYLLSTMNLGRLSVQSAQPGLSVKTLSKQIVNLPSLDIQNKIVGILASIDDKIDSNNAINYNLLQLCLLQYRNLSSQNTPNGYIGDIIVESPKSKIKVGDAKGVSGTYPFFTSGQAILEYETNLVDGRNIYLNTGGNADVKYYIGPASYSTDTWCIHGVNELTDYLYLALLDMKDEIEQTCFDGSTLKHLQKQKLRDKPVYIPSEDDIHILATIKANLDLISHNQRENKKLANLRDALLPKLISGALDVSDVNI